MQALTELLALRQARQRQRAQELPTIQTAWGLRHRLAPTTIQIVAIPTRLSRRISGPAPNRGRLQLLATQAQILEALATGVMGAAVRRRLCPGPLALVVEELSRAHKMVGQRMLPAPAAEQALEPVHALAHGADS